MLLYAVKWPSDPNKTVMIAGARTKDELFHVIDEIDDPMSALYLPLHNFAIDLKAVPGKDPDDRQIELRQYSDSVGDVVLDRDEPEPGWKQIFTETPYEREYRERQTRCRETGK